MSVIKYKHVLVDEENFAELSKLGTVRDSYNDVIRKFLREHREKDVVALTA